MVAGQFYGWLQKLLKNNGFSIYLLRAVGGRWLVGGGGWHVLGWCQMVGGGWQAVRGWWVVGGG